jgi:hypothetical protein
LAAAKVKAVAEAGREVEMVAEEEEAAAASAAAAALARLNAVLGKRYPSPWQHMPANLVVVTL